MNLHSTWMRYLALCVTFAVLGTLAWPILPLERYAHYDIAITALGEKSPAAQGSEVWIVGFPQGISAGAMLAARSTPNGWEQRGSELVSYRDQPSTVTFRGGLPAGGEFLFLRHAWSGRFQVTVNGVSRVRDLYAPESSLPLAVRLREFPAGQPVWTLNRRFFVSVAGWTLGLAIIVLAAGQLLPRLTPSPPALPQWRASFVFGLPALLVFLAVLAGTWPAQMSPDSVDQWNQLHTGKFHNAHPVVHTWLVGSIGAWLGSPAWSMLAQIIALAWAIGYFCAELAAWRVNRLAVWAVAVVTPLWPATALLSTAYWKDIPFSIAACVLTVLVLRALRTGGECFRKPTYLATFALTLFLTATLRHNGLLVSAGVVLLLVVVCRRELSMTATATATSAGLVLPLVWSMAILPAAGIPGVGRHYHGMIPMHVLGAYLAEGAALDPATEVKLREILPIESWNSGYNCWTVVPLFWAPGIRYDKLTSSLLKPALAAILANPMPAIRHHICVNSLNWRMSPHPGVAGALTPLGVYREPNPKPWAVTANPVPALKNAAERVVNWTTATPIRFSIFWRPATLHLVLAFAAAFALLHGMPWRYLLVLSPVAFNTLSLVPLIGSQDFRYQYPVVLMTPLLLVFFAGIVAARSSGKAGGAGEAGTAG